MARPKTGTFEARKLADGSKVFHLRFWVDGNREPEVLHERRGCVCGCGGGWDEVKAKAELVNILERVRVGVWKPRGGEPAGVDAGGQGRVLRYCAFSEKVWLPGKVSGVIGKKRIGPNTVKDYVWRLGYSQDHFGEMPVIEIGRRGALGFRASLINQAQADREAMEAGAVLRDRHGRRRQPLCASSIKKILDAFAAVLDEAIEQEEDEREEDGSARRNPARIKRMQIAVPKPKRTFLEMDELSALLDAASEQEVPLPDLTKITVAEGSTAEKVVRLAAAGKRPAQIAEDLDVAKSTVTYHLRNNGIALDSPYVGRRVVIEILGRAGLRVSELCDLRIGDVRLHDPEGARLRILDAKTEKGERIVAITPDQAEVIVEHIDRLRRAGFPVGPDDYFVPNTRGGRMSRQRAWKIVREAAQLANEYLKKKGLAALPNTTPHTLRRTFISIALLANNFDVKYVMDLVGHEDSTMTMDVYAQLQQRVERKHGANFDRLMRRAKKQLSGIPVAA